MNESEYIRSARDVLFFHSHLYFLKHLSQWTLFPPICRSYRRKWIRYLGKLIEAFGARIHIQNNNSNNKNNNNGSFMITKTHI